MAEALCAREVAWLSDCIDAVSAASCAAVSGATAGAAGAPADESAARAWGSIEANQSVKPGLMPQEEPLHEHPSWKSPAPPAP